MTVFRIFITAVISPVWLADRLSNETPAPDTKHVLSLSYEEIAVCCRPMKNTLSGNEGKGFMKIIVAADSDKVVGVHLIGPETAEIIQVSCGHLTHDGDHHASLPSCKTPALESLQCPGSKLRYQAPFPYDDSSAERASHRSDRSASLPAMTVCLFLLP